MSMLGSDLKTALAWEMFCTEMEEIEVGELFELQMLKEARRQCDIAGISLEALVSYGETKNAARP
jgi:hypothetical protein